MYALAYSNGQQLTNDTSIQSANTTAYSPSQLATDAHLPTFAHISINSEEDLSDLIDSPLPTAS